MSIECREYSWERALTADVQIGKMEGASHDKKSQLGIRLMFEVGCGYYLLGTAPRAKTSLSRGRTRRNNELISLQVDPEQCLVGAKAADRI